MRCRNRKWHNAFLLAGMMLLWLCLGAFPALADPTDRILDFTITVDVNEDASLRMAYHIDWEVLDVQDHHQRAANAGY